MTMWSNTQEPVYLADLFHQLEKIGGYVFKGIDGLFHHHKVQAIYHAVNTFKK